MSEKKSLSFSFSSVVLLIFFSFALFFGCAEKVPVEELSSEAILYSFTLDEELNPGLEESLTVSFFKHKASLTLPYGVALNNLVASFEYEGASVKVGDVEQISGVTPNDFSEPVTYRVIAEDGTEADFTVVVLNDSPRIPQVFIDTEGGAPILDKENYVNSTLIVKDLDRYYSDEVSFTGVGGVKGRGNSTWGMDKKPYRVKLDEKASLLGLSKDKSWAMLANHTDKTLLRNITAFEISRIAEMRWTPASYSVDFYLNGSYKGVYALTEHVKVSKDRLDLDLVEDGEVTGDYFLELDFHYDEPAKFKTEKEKLPIMFKDPEEPSNEQFEYVKSQFNKAEEILYSESFTDPDDGYRKYIDVPSFINYYIVQELAKNVDGNMRGSCYMALLSDGKIMMPLVWDFDIAFGNADHITWEQGASSREYDGWFIKTCSPWFDRFFQDPSFVSELKARWNELKPRLDGVPGFIREHAELLEQPQARNFKPVSAGGAGWNINKAEWNTSIVRGSYQAEVDYLVDFVRRRIDWLDVNINNL